MGRSLAGTAFAFIAVLDSGINCAHTGDVQSCEVCVAGNFVASLLVLLTPLRPADANRKLTLLYLANDIAQNSKKKGQEYKAEFTRVLPRAFHLVSKYVRPHICAAFI